MSTLVRSQAQIRYRPVVATEGPAPETVETLVAGARVGMNDAPVNKDLVNSSSYFDLIDAVGEVNGKSFGDYRPWSKTLRQFVPFSSNLDVYDLDALWSDIAEIKRRDPKALSTITTREAFEGKLAAGSERVQDARRTVARGPGAAAFVGQAIGGIADPSSLLGTGIAAKSVVGAMALAAGENAVIELAQEPLKRQQAAMGGQTRDLGDVAWDVGAAGGGGALIGGAIKGVELGAPKVGAAVGERVDATRAGLERLLADHWEKLPEAVRTRWAKGATIADADLPDLAEAMVGRGNMSVDERAAVDGMRREAQIVAASPFKPDMAGDAAHRVRMDSALAALLEPVARQPRAFALPPRAELAGGTSLSTGATPPRAELKARIGRAESPSDTAKNPLSSATGRYQFVSGTWLRYYKRRFGDQGLTDAQILAKRTDGRIQESLMDDLIDDNARFLRTVGEAETAGNLYLVHFAGPGGARKLFTAEPSARAADVLGADVARANPWLRNYSAGDVIAWAHRKMNEPAPRRAGARPELTEGAGSRDMLQREIDRLDAEADAARAARMADDPLGDALAGIETIDPRIDATPVLADLDLPDVVPMVRDMAADGLPDRTAALVPALRAELEQSGAIDVVDLSRRLDASEDEIRMLTDRVAANEAPPLRDAEGAPLPARKAQAKVATEVRRALKAEGWKVDGDTATREFDGMGGPGVAASGRRVVTLRIDKGGRVLERIDGGKVGVSVDLPRFGDDVRGAVRAGLSGMRREAGDLFEGRAVRRATAAEAPARVEDIAARDGWADASDRAAVELGDSVWHDLDALARAAGDEATAAPVQLDDGPARTWGDVVDEVNEDAAAVAAIKACL